MSNEKRETPLKMVKGLPGFEDVLLYTLKEVPGNAYFYWLEAEEGPGFLLSKPGYFFDDYQIRIDRSSLEGLKLEDDKEPEVYCIITVPENPADMTANLLAPLFVNEEQGLAYQIVLQNVPYTTRHLLFSPERHKNCG